MEVRRGSQEPGEDLLTQRMRLMRDCHARSNFQTYKSDFQYLAHLNNSCTYTGSYDRSCCAHVEHIVPVTASADHVHHKVLICTFNNYLQRARSEYIGSCSKCFWSSFDTFDMKCGEKSADLRGVCAFRVEDMGKGGLEIIWIEVFGCLDKLGKQRFEGFWCWCRFVHDVGRERMRVSSHARRSLRKASDSDWFASPISWLGCHIHWQ